MKKMKQTILKGCRLALFSTLFLGVVSCSQDSDSMQPEPAAKVVSEASFSMTVGEDSGSQTRAALSGNTLNWQVGDRLVMASNGQINGTLTCTEVNGSTGVATFNGNITNFTPAGVNIYFLSNREAGSMTPSFDFSMQNGTAQSASNFVFLKKTGVVLAETSEGSGEYAPTATINFDCMMTLLTLTLNPDGSPAAKTPGTVATGVSINGMKNVMQINLADGTVTSSYAKQLDGTTDNTVTTVAPTSIMEYTTEYLMAVIPQNATDLTMRVDYLKPDASTETTLWSNINWDLSEKAGRKVSTNWTGDKAPTIVETSAKNGYSGSAVEGGENADGQSHKGGYGGANVGDESDNPYGGKNGYSGGEVI